jgi:hypothetical protein
MTKMNEKPALMLPVNSLDFAFSESTRYLARHKIDPAERESFSDRLFICAKNALNKTWWNNVVGECRIKEMIDGTPDAIRAYAKKVNTKKDSTLVRIEGNSKYDNEVMRNPVRLYKVTDLHKYPLPNNWWGCWGLESKPRTAKLIKPEHQPFLYEVKKGCFSRDLINSLWLPDEQEDSLYGFVPMWSFFDNADFIDELYYAKEGRPPQMIKWDSIDSHQKYGTFFEYREDAGYYPISRKCVADMLEKEIFKHNELDRLYEAGEID